MRINIYSQELTDEVLLVSKESNTLITYSAVQFVLHSSPKLHHPPKDDDRSAVTFWIPRSQKGGIALHKIFLKAAQLVIEAPPEAAEDNFEKFINERLMRNGKP